jgi:hypothetical protein
MTHIETLKQWREALENTLGFTGSRQIDSVTRQAITSINQAIAEAEKQERTMKVEGPIHVVCQCDKCEAEKQEQGEPVGFYDASENDICTEIPMGESGDCWQPVYTTPQPKRKPLTDEQIQAIWNLESYALPQWSRHIAFARAIEAAHGITSDMKQEHVDKTAKQRHEWVGLTDEEANELWESTDSDWELMKRVEAKLKEKNT